MQLPKNSPDLDVAKDKLHEDYAKLEKILLERVDILAQSGFADKRWCAIARTGFEQGFMALHRALRDYPTDDGRQYGKLATATPDPPEFQPPVDPDGAKQIAERRQIPWSDYDADGDLGPPGS